MTIAVSMSHVPSLPPFNVFRSPPPLQLETLALRLSAHSGWAGLAGMRSEQAVRVSNMRSPLRLRRPLLNTRKAALVTHCRHHGVQWAEDPTNATDKYARNRARMALARLVDAATQCKDTAQPLDAGLLALQAILQSARSKVETRAAAALSVSATMLPQLAAVRLDCAALLAAVSGDPAVYAEALRCVLAAVSGRALVAPAAVARAAAFFKKTAETRGAAAAPTSVAAGGCLLHVPRGGAVVTVVRQPPSRREAASHAGLLPAGGVWWDGRVWLAPTAGAGAVAVRAVTAADVPRLAEQRPANITPVLWLAAMRGLPLVAAADGLGPARCPLLDECDTVAEAVWEPLPQTLDFAVTLPGETGAQDS